MKCFEVYSPDFCACHHLLLVGVGVCECVCVLSYVHSPEAPIVTRFQLRFS